MTKVQKAEIYTILSSVFGELSPDAKSRQNRRRGNESCEFSPKLIFLQLISSHF